MAMANQYLPFGTGVGANTLSYGAYVATTDRLPGYASGTASSTHINTTLRQLSVGVCGLAAFAADYGTHDMNDDGVPGNFEVGLKSAIDALIFAAAHPLPISGTPNGFKIGPLIVYFGNTAVFGGDTAGNGVSFPTPFPTACIAVVGSASTDNGAGGGSAERYSVGLCNWTPTGFIVNNDSYATSVAWIALGY